MVERRDDQHLHETPSLNRAALRAVQAARGWNMDKWNKHGRHICGVQSLLLGVWLSHPDYSHFHLGFQVQGGIIRNILGGFSPGDLCNPLDLDGRYK